MRRENHVGVPDVAAARARHPARPACGIGQARVDVERDVGEAHHEAGVAQPPQRGRDGQSAVDFFDQFAADFSQVFALVGILPSCRSLQPVPDRRPVRRIRRHLHRDPRPVLRVQLMQHAIKLAPHKAPASSGMRTRARRRPECVAPDIGSRAIRSSGCAAHQNQRRSRAVVLLVHARRWVRAPACAAALLNFAHRNHSGPQ